MDANKSRRSGNRHSTLLDQLVTAAENAKPEVSTTFADSIIKIANTKPAYLTAAMTNNTIKCGQITRSVDPGTNSQNEFDVDANPDLNEGGALEGTDSMPVPESEKVDIQAVKTRLSETLIELCGSLENAIACLEESSGMGTEDSMSDSVSEMPPTMMPEMPNEPELA